MHKVLLMNFNLCFFVHLSKKTCFQRVEPETGLKGLKSLVKEGNGFARRLQEGALFGKRSFFWRGPASVTAAAALGSYKKRREAN